MSIKPIDYTNLISKSQEVAKIKQVENNKVRVQTELGLIQQKKQNNNNMKKVRNTEKNENKIIDRNKKDNKKDNEKESEKEEKKKEKDKKNNNKRINELGVSIDIKI